MLRNLLLLAFLFGLSSCTQYGHMTKYDGKLYITGASGPMSIGWVKECTRTGPAELSCLKVDFPSNREQQKEGRWTVWNTNGQTKRQDGEYRGGKRCGNWLLWDEDGAATSCVPSTRNTRRLNPRGLEVCSDGCSPTLTGMICEPCQ
jgi:hypothetical protein